MTSYPVSYWKLSERIRRTFLFQLMVWNVSGWQPDLSTIHLESTTADWQSAELTNLLPAPTNLQLFAPARPQSQPARECLLRKHFTNLLNKLTPGPHTHQFTNSLIHKSISNILFEMLISCGTPCSQLPAPRSTKPGLLIT
jgi:hypothetical protein